MAAREDETAAISLMATEPKLPLRMDWSEDVHKEWLETKGVTDHISMCSS